MESRRLRSDRKDRGRAGHHRRHDRRVTQTKGADIIEKALQAKDCEIDRLNKRIEELLAEPMPPKTAGSYGLVAVSKEQDSGGAQSFGKVGPSQDEIARALSEMTEEDRAMLLIKAAQRLPRPATMARFTE